MAKHTPTTISSGYNSASTIDANFQSISDELNDNVLYRNNPAGEPNEMNNDLDMNSNAILNSSRVDTNELRINGVILGVEAPTVGSAIEETVVLSSGQTTVTFVNEVSGGEIYLNGNQVDSGRLLSAEDYNISGANSVTLSQSYPAGSSLTLYISASATESGNSAAAAAASAVAAAASESAASTSAGNAASSASAAAASAVSAADAYAAGFVGLPDTPASYAGQMGKAAIVNASEDGIEFGSVSSTAAGLSYSNTTSGLTATNVQDAVDEVEARVDTLEVDTHTHANKAVLDATTASFTLADETKLDGITTATTTTEGLVEKSTSAENIAGVSDTVYPSVAGVKEIVDTFSLPNSTTETTGNLNITSSDATFNTIRGEATVNSGVEGTTSAIAAYGGVFSNTGGGAGLRVTQGTAQFADDVTFDTDITVAANATVKGYTEIVHTMTSAAVVASNGTWQKRTLAGNETLTFTIAAGQSVFVTVVPGANTLTLSNVSEWVGGSAPASVEAEHLFVFWSDDGVTVSGLSIGGIS